MSERNGRISRSRRLNTEMYTALRRLGVPTRLVVYPGQSHGITKPSYQRDVLTRYLSWYDQWLQ